MEQVEAVLFAHKPGRNTIRRDADRAFRRLFLWLLHRSHLPLSVRDAAVGVVWKIGEWLFGRNGRWAIFVGASKGNTFENDLLKLIFNATAIANIADNAATAPLTDLRVSLHTGDPGEGGTQATSEIAYTGYARILVARTTGGWTESVGSVSPVAAITFGEMTGGAGGTVTHAVIGTDTTGAGKLLYSGTVTPNIVVSTGVTPSLKTTSTITED